MGTQLRTPIPLVAPFNLVLLGEVSDEVKRLVKHIVPLGIDSIVLVGKGNRVDVPIVGEVFVGFRHLCDEQVFEVRIHTLIYRGRNGIFHLSGKKVDDPTSQLGAAEPATQVDVESEPDEHVKGDVGGEDDKCSLHN